MFKGRQPLENAPYWYNTPLDKLDFEWSPEEEREIERICEKIHKNIEEEGGMTPLERFRAAMWGKDKDRMFMEYRLTTPTVLKPWILLPMPISQSTYTNFPSCM